MDQLYRASLQYVIHGNYALNSAKQFLNLYIKIFALVDFQAKINYLCLTMPCQILICRLQLSIKFFSVDNSGTWNAPFEFLVFGKLPLLDIDQYP